MINGIVKDKFGNLISNCEIYLKDEYFKNIKNTRTDKQGRFEIEDCICEYLVAVKDYKEDKLEYWCKNPYLSNGKTLDIVIDKLEVYELNSFIVNGGYPSLFIYFRPMSLPKYINKSESLFPDGLTVKVEVDGKDCRISNMQKVKEYAGDMKYLDALLIQVKGNEKFDRIDIKITDKDGNIGTATLFKKHNKV